MSWKDNLLFAWMGLGIGLFIINLSYPRWAIGNWVFILYFTIMLVWALRGIWNLDNEQPSGIMEIFRALLEVYLDPTRDLRAFQARAKIEEKLERCEQYIDSLIEEGISAFMKNTFDENDSAIKKRMEDR